MPRDAIIQAAIEHCWQEEQLAHAEWTYGMTAARRADLANDEKHPWRSIMRTSARTLLDLLEADGFYDNAPLHGAGAHKRTPAVYQHSPYDYEVARRVEGMVAERKWQGKDDAP